MEEQKQRVLCSIKKVFLEILQNSRKSTSARVSFLIKLQADPATLLKKRLRHRCFPVNFAKFSRTPFLKEHLRWLLLEEIYPIKEYDKTIFYITTFMVYIITDC